MRIHSCASSHVYVSRVCAYGACTQARLGYLGAGATLLASSPLTAYLTWHQVIAC